MTYTTRDILFSEPYSILVCSTNIFQRKYFLRYLYVKYVLFSFSWKHAVVLNTRVVLLKPCQLKHCSSNLSLTWFKHNLFGFFLSMVFNHFLVVLGDGERPQFSGGVVLAINRIVHRKDQQSHCHTGQWYGYKLMYNVSHLYYKHGQSQRYLFIYVTEYNIYSRFSLWQRLIIRGIKNDIVKNLILHFSCSL